MTSNKTRQAPLHVVTGGAPPGSRLSPREQLDSAAVPLLCIDRDGVITQLNTPAAALLSRLCPNPLGETLWPLVGATPLLEEQFPAEQGITPLLRGLPLAEGSYDLYLNGSTETAHRYVVTLVPVGQRQRLEEDLEDMRKRLKQVVEAVSEGLLVVDVDQRKVVDINPTGLKILGRERSAVIGQTCQQLICRECQGLCAQLPQTGSYFSEELLQTPQGATVPVMRSARQIQMNNKEYILIGLVDISGRKQAEAEISRLAYFDRLTGLPNRSLLHDRLQQALAGAQREQLQLAVLQLDLDHFKDINSSLGHQVGDRLLGLVGQRLQAAVRRNDTVARVGSDEYVILLNGLRNAAQAAVVARKLIAQLELPFLCEERQFFLSGSIGIAVYPEDGDDVSSLLKHADAALGLAKGAGRGCYRFFTAEMDSLANQKLQLATDLHRVLELDQLQVHYQPQVDIGSQQIKGFEALLRWQHPQLGTVSPLQFIPLAEENGTIVGIGEWVLRTACQQLKKWHAQRPDLRMAVNISASQFRLADLDQVVARVLKETRLEPSCLELELTESVLVENIDESRRLMERIRAMGVRLAIDDFGTGYSSLGYLKHFPIDRLKIDRSFVSDIEQGVAGAAIVKTVIALAESLGRGIIAEGVETEQQLEFLRQQQCMEVQGYYFWQPLAVEAAEKLLA